MTNHTRLLYLVRHAEASLGDFSQTDFDRPLSEQGQQDARWIASRLAHRVPKPTAIVSSPAVRAKSTTAFLVEGAGFPPANVLFDPRLYEAELEDLMAVLSEVEASVSCLMLIGHNPSCTQLVNALVPDPIADLQPGGLVVLKFHLELWLHIHRTKAELLAIEYPAKRSDTDPSDMS